MANQPAEAPAKAKADIQVEKPTPYTFDLGILTAYDANPINDAPDGEAPSAANLEARLASTARDGAQSLINQLLTTLPLTSTSDGVLLGLPPATTPLPREKPVPEAKPPTKWEQFAARKGIKPKTRAQRAMHGKEYNEEKGRWEASWGHDRGGKATDRKRAREEGLVQSDWLVEVDEKAEREGGQGRDGRGGPAAKGPKGKKPSGNIKVKAAGGGSNKRRRT